LKTVELKLGKWTVFRKLRRLFEIVQDERPNMQGLSLRAYSGMVYGS
jgi:hypothetical protein